MKRSTREKALKLRILFVDDEQNILDGLRRMLRPLSSQWDMAFVQNGPEALTCLGRCAFDVLVTDMRMPGMDGAHLLAEVQRRFPDVVRIVLTGQCDCEAAMRSVSLAHRVLTKPCEPEVLKATIARVLSLRALLQSAELQRLLSQLQTIPTLPSLHAEVLRELDAPEPSLVRVAEIISQDLGMTAKIIQVANSALFGIRMPVSSVKQAVSLLGCQNIRLLVLASGVFSLFQSNGLPPFSADAMWQHSLRVSKWAQTIALEAGAHGSVIPHATLAGLLHDVGRLVLIANLPAAYEAIVHQAKQTGKPLCEVERSVLGATHAEVGAYVLGLWGFPEPIVEAVAWHHTPSACADELFSALTAVHAADTLLAQEWEAQTGLVEAPPDSDYLKRLGLARRMDEWREIQLCLAEHEGLP
jgi:HD-like signal output (HDOD) protein